MSTAAPSSIGIIGAGISGLTLAWRLQQQGIKVTVLDEATAPGGAMHSHREGPYIAEDGPHSILVNSREIDAFLKSIPGLEERIIDARPDAQKRFIVRNRTVHTVPTGPLSAVTTPLWSFKGKLRVLKEPFVKALEAGTEESVADFVRRRLGDELYRYAINPLVGGIYAGRPEELSLRYGFPKLYALEQEHGGLIRGALAKMKASRKERKSGASPFKKRMISFNRGMGELPETLAAALGTSVRFSVSINSVQKAGDGWSVSWTDPGGTEANAGFDRLILTVPAHRLQSLPLPDPVRADLRPLEAIDYPPVSVLSLAFRRADVAHPLDGFGALVPECEGMNILGVLFPASLFEGRTPSGEVLLTAFVGGSRQPELATADTDALLGTVLPDLRELLGVTGQPLYCHHRHWPKAIPQYKLGYQDHLAQMESVEAKHRGLRLAGNYRTGISVSYCIEAALNAKF